jgi:hypothetical protein
MHSKVKQYLDDLKQLQRSSPAKRKALFKNAPPQLIDCISECCSNCLNRAVPLKKAQFVKLKRHKKLLRKLASKKVSKQIKKKLLSQQGGFIAPLITAILTAVATKLLKL